jgi:peroxiredoxin
MKCSYLSVTLFLVGSLIMTLTTDSFAEPLAVGSKAPSFSLKNVDGTTVSLSDFADKEAVVVVFTCNTCPFAMAYQDRLIALQNDYAAKGVQFVLISSNDIKIKPDDSYEKMQIRAKEKNYPFPYLYDETQVIAKAYGASRTPEAFLLDKTQTAIYTGRIDDNTEAKQVTQHDLKNAIDLLLAGQAAEINPKATKAFGCTIKWKS